MSFRIEAAAAITKRQLGLKRPSGGL